ncbi:hypothetical protein BHE74_00017942 [Ensete ventricosum]|nr:hypothetical protein GW17_00023305 [Ensete ventricosum]RWW74134.1 hypothetical protein BHE74_00017942 [Ensete ventricosum]
MGKDGNFDRDLRKSYHLLQEGVAIFRQLDIPSSPDEPTLTEINAQSPNKRSDDNERERERERRLHLDGALGAEIGPEDVLETLGGVNVHVERRRLVQHLGVRIQHTERHLGVLSSDRHTVEPKQKRRRRQQRDQARVGF